jgi:hypothetical protein
VTALKALRPSPALVVATIALLVALGGSGYAAVALTLPANSVGTAQLKSNAVISSKVKDHSLLKADFASGQIPAGPRGAPGAPGAPGPAGARGPTGPAGTASTKWALVGKDGTLIAGSTGVVVVQASAGQYYVNFGSSVAGHAVEATSVWRNADFAVRGSVVVAICGSTGTTPPPDTYTCTLNNNTNTVYVVTLNANNSLPESHAFYVAVF